jgi:hypothetical protein
MSRRRKSLNPLPYFLRAAMLSDFPPDFPPELESFNRPAREIIRDLRIPSASAPLVLG